MNAKYIAVIVLLAAVVICPSVAVGQNGTTVMRFALTAPYTFPYDPALACQGEIDFVSGDDVIVTTTIIKPNSVFVNTLEYYDHAVGVADITVNGTAVKGVIYRFTSFSDSYTFQLSNNYAEFTWMTFVKAVAHGKGPDLYGYSIMRDRTVQNPDGSWGDMAITVDKNVLVCPAPRGH